MPGQDKIFVGGVWKTLGSGGGGSGGSGTDEKAKVSANDTTAGYLNGKLTAGSGITLTEGSDGGNETLAIAATTASFATDFSVKQSADTALTTATTYYQIQFDTVNRDVNSEWVAADKNWKCKTAGTYLCGFTVRFATGTTGTRNAYFRVNGEVPGTESKGLYAYQNTSSGTKASFCTAFSFSINDTLDIICTSSTNTQNVTKEATEFWIIRYK
jgi:hypothetical protein